MKRILAAVLIAMSLSLGAAQNGGPTTIQLILDASGSMFNTLEDGRYRITAAKDVLSDFISALPASENLNVGLRIYGSQVDAREEGACEDSELFVPMDGFDRQALLQTVRDTQARGATPIAYSLQLAARDFQGVEGNKVLVLVTDGKEACGGDVRKAAEELAASGIDVDLHIIGFDLSESAAASFEGIGTFENARNAEQLAQALTRAVESSSQAQQATYQVTVNVTRDGEPAEGAGVTLISAVSDNEIELSVQETGTLGASVPAGRYRAVVEDALTDEPQTVSNIDVTPEGDNTFIFELGQANTVSVSVAPAEPVAGSRVTVSFEGAPQAEGNWITVVPADAADTAYAEWEYVDGASGSVELQTPAQPGELQARFLVSMPGGGDRVLGRSDVFTTVEPQVSLAAPAEVIGGSSFEVEWSGPDNQGDYITIVPEGAAQGEYMNYAYTRDGSPAQITAPVEPGQYELRYVAGQSGSPTLAYEPITVVAAEYAVKAPEEIIAGSTFEVQWSGPDNQGDYITIVPEGAAQGEYMNYAYTRDGNPVQITAPAQPGEYEVRYVSGQGGSPTMARDPITVVAGEYDVEAPAEVEPRSTFQVTWTGPNNSQDYITVVPEGAPQGEYMSYAYTSDGNPVTLTAPSEPGTYEVRYTTDQNPQPTLASTTITVVSVEYGLDAPDSVEAGTSFQVSWTGPNGSGDYITIVPAGASEGEYKDYAYTRDGNPVTLQAPEEPGAYEVRYQTDQHGVFASTPITIE